MTHSIRSSHRGWGVQMTLARGDPSLKGVMCMTNTRGCPDYHGPFKTLLRIGLSGKGNAFQEHPSYKLILPRRILTMKPQEDSDNQTLTSHQIFGSWPS